MEFSKTASRITEEGDVAEKSKVDPDVTSWWDALSDLLKGCFTSARVDLEIENGDRKSLECWSMSSAADVLSSGDAKCKEMIMTFVADDVIGIKILLKIMEEYPCPNAKHRESTSKVLREIVNPKNGAKLRSAVIKQAIAAGYISSTILILKDLVRQRSITKLPEEKGKTENVLVNFLWFLSAVVTHDSTFSVQIRDMLKVRFFHFEVYKKLFYAKSSAHYPLLKILRQLARSEATVSILGKEGVMNSIRKSFTVLSNMPGGKLLLVMDILCQLTKKKNNCTRFLKAGLLAKTLQVFSNWELWRGKGLYRLSRVLISIYTHVARTNAGRKVITKSNVIFEMRKFCEACPSEKSFDEVIQRVCELVALTYQKDFIPLPKLDSPITFQIPEGVKRLNDIGSSSDDEGSDDEEVMKDDEEASDGYEGSIISDDEDALGTDDELNGEDDEERQAQLALQKAKRTPTAKRPSSEKPTVVKTLREAQEKPLTDFKQYFPEFDTVLKGRLLVITRRLSSSTSTPVSRSLTSLFDADTKAKTLKKIPTSKHEYEGITDNPECTHTYWTSVEDLRKEFAMTANAVKNVTPFVKIAYPEFSFAYSMKSEENMLHNADRHILRQKIISYITRIIGGESFYPKVVYSLDNLVGATSPSSTVPTQSVPPPTRLTNSDERQIGKHNKKHGLMFESRFESGNLRKAIQIGDREYDLLLTSDVNSNRHNQWFYFEVSNTLNDKSYTFNIINCTKSNSLFNYGMQAVVFSVTDAMNGKAGWVRSGTDICYYKNGYRNFQAKKKSSNKVYHTLSFNLTFAHKADVVYIAYHIPYTYTRMMVELNAMLHSPHKRGDVVVRYDSLCKTLNQNEVPLLTITAPMESNYVNDRQIIFLTGRVHPGETNASWVMKGILEFLIFGKTLQVKQLLRKYVFKIVPMLNVEGVINGCHRCGLTSEDLNRCWKSPSEILHPTIYYTKMLIEYCCRNLKLTPVLYCDLHGHSRRKNAFFYGCSYGQSWNAIDNIQLDDTAVQSLPQNMDRVSSAFSLSHCNHSVKKTRESTARVAVWREYRIARSYTLECSYCGCDRGDYKGIAFGTNQLMEIGRDLCKAILEL